MLKVCERKVVLWLQVSECSSTFNTLPTTLSLHSASGTACKGKTTFQQMFRCRISESMFLLFLLNLDREVFIVPLVCEDASVKGTCMIVSSRSRTMRFVSVAKFPLIRASWSNSAFVLINKIAGVSQTFKKYKDQEKRTDTKEKKETK